MMVLEAHSHGYPLWVVSSSKIDGMIMGFTDLPGFTMIKHYNQLFGMIMTFHPISCDNNVSVRHRLSTAWGSTSNHSFPHWDHTAMQCPPVPLLLPHPATRAANRCCRTPSRSSFSPSPAWLDSAAWDQCFIARGYDWSSLHPEFLIGRYIYFSWESNIDWTYTLTW